MHDYNYIASSNGIHKKRVAFLQLSDFFLEDFGRTLVKLYTLYQYPRLKDICI